MLVIGHSKTENNSSRDLRHQSSLIMASGVSYYDVSCVPPASPRYSEEPQLQYNIIDAPYLPQVLRVSVSHYSLWR